MNGTNQTKGTHKQTSESLSSSLSANVANIKETFRSCDDFVYHQMDLNQKSVAVFYVSHLVNNQEISDLHKMLSSQEESLLNRTLHAADQINSIAELASEVLSGHTVIIVDGVSHAYSFQTKKTTGGAVREANSERTVRGPQEGFVEDLDTNLMLIRKRIRTPSLKIENTIIGTQTQTQVSVVYIEGIVNDDLVKEVHRRLAQINIDGILESQYIESMIKDSPKSPFPTIYSTERPDQVCGNLLEGKVAIMIDGTPFVLTAPTVFVEFLHAREDYYGSSLVATVLRWVRFLGMFVALILPAFYVAMTSFHQDLLQTSLLIRIAAHREELPYPVLVEGLFMVLTFELIREAGIRMPKSFGGAVITILGLVLIGQAAVQANIIGPVMMVVVSTTALVSFILPNYAFHQIIRLCGVPLLLLAGFFGFMGILVGLMFGLTHLVSLRSFEVPYLSPVSPARKEGWKDVFIRAPWWAMTTRPPGMGVANQYRESHSVSPVEKEER
ncbi:spore germination protein [Bacillus fonticola]|uniref:spore germination protein n=1 Tax=Bacillus fonticola TaxID=2728853 RepID=UPI0014751A54|nr:spore germination protein [Bacillus fonticola]